LLLFSCAVMAQGGLLRIEVSERSDVLNGRAPGAAGPYERIVGKAFFAVDPGLAANKAVADLSLAPRNERGMVEFSSDIYVLKPRDSRAGNGAVLFEVANRGRKGTLGMFNFASGSMDPRSEREFGDSFLLEKGYTLVWLGWQFDVPKDPALMRLYTPVAKGVRGLVRAEILVDRKVTSHPVADRDHTSYPVLNAEDPKLVLTVRDRVDGERKTVPRSEWRIEERTRIVMKSGFEPGRLYELVYTSEDPPIAGLGLTAVRDVISFFKYGGNNITVLGDQRQYIRHAYGFGVSQSGRFLRTFLYYGFNRDERERKVFDGLMVHVAGGGRGSFNQRFAQPSRSGNPFQNTLYPTDIFPFADLGQTDPETGLTDGLLTHAMPPEAAPKIFYTNSSHEYYGRAASLIHTHVDVSRDSAIPETTRIYLFAGGQHGPSAFPPPRNPNAQNRPNPVPYTIAMRALLTALDAWVRDGKNPPPSQFPKGEQLVKLGDLRFPKIPGVALPSRIQTAYRADYGPEFRGAGVATIEPPKVGTAFLTLVPQVDRDGNDIAGVRMPQVQWPLATYTGWNLRSKEAGAPDEIYSLLGSWIPFARTKAERLKTGDSRLSIEERYATREEYLQKIGAAARRLVDQGYLLDRDVARVSDRAGQEWDEILRK
jgi:hypothetical protein